MKQEKTMKGQQRFIFYGWLGLLIVSLLHPQNGFAQTFNSGSTGADGPFAPTANITLTLPPDGVFHYTTIDIPAGVEVTFTNNADNTPVTFLATGDVNINGTINVNGKRGADWDFSSGSAVISPGGAGGPGGFAGGQSGARGTTNTFPSPGQGPGGGNPSPLNLGPHYGGKYGAPPSFINLIPLFGGSGGAGGRGFTTTPGTSGGGGGGAILIASSTKITVTGSITANGGGSGNTSNSGTEGGGGGGGAIRLVAGEVTSSGVIQALGGFGPGFASGGLGRIRIEAFIIPSFGSINPTPSTSFSPGAVNAASNPSLINLPTLSIGTIGGIPSPSNPSGSLTSADVALPAGTTNPVPVTLTATNTPVGTVFTVKLSPQFAIASSVSTGPSTGSFSSSTASADVTLPVGIISLIDAFASFSIPDQLASLLPSINGEPVERVMLAAKMGQTSTLTLVTKSGKEIPAKEVISDEQLALLWKGVMLQK